LTDEIFNEILMNSSYCAITLLLPN